MVSRFAVKNEHPRDTLILHNLGSALRRLHPINAENNPKKVHPNQNKAVDEIYIFIYTVYTDTLYQMHRLTWPGSQRFAGR